MSKKKFTDGLESLFNTDAKGDVSGKGTAFLRGAAVKKEEKKVVRRSKKNFTTDLDSLLEEALQESFEEQMSQKDKAQNSNKSHYQKQTRRPMTGLDVLIRRTVEAGAIEESRKTGVKRLTVTFDKNKIAKLKRIARMEKAYLKDILGDLVAEYIKDYENKKGHI